MFNAVFKKAQQSVDNALSEIASKSVVAIPFVLAAGFGIAALTVRLHNTYSAETANLILASGFAGLGILVAMIEAVRQRNRRRAAAANGSQAEKSPEPAEATPVQSLFGDADREIVMAALSSAAPLAIPYVMRSTFKNLPLVALVAAVGFVLSRNSQADGPDLQPAE
jgi:hypothetical protein